GLATASGLDPFVYFVQAGAFGRSEDAEQQRARLAMLGLEAKLTEREQSGRTVFRVRLGPYERKTDADSAKDKLGQAGIESALVRVQRQ
ncbi:MAG TPA: SPOR domain-containing protein, partial [Burkholderiaceae bacterium]|nr:SPOR domain-containing protein [Burkholderiaceae bacterium]